MALQLGAYARTTPRAAAFLPHKYNPVVILAAFLPFRDRRRRRGSRIWVSNGEDDNSYLDMWKKAVDRERKSIEFQQIAEKPAGIGGGGGGVEDSPEALEKKSSEFQKILQVSKEERDRIQQMQVIDRAAAAIAAARAILKDSPPPPSPSQSTKLSPPEVDSGGWSTFSESDGGIEFLEGGTENGNMFVPQSESSGIGTPGPDFWSWTPPDRDSADDTINLQPAEKTSYPVKYYPLLEKERPDEFLTIPFESSHNPPLPPLQSLLDVEKVEPFNPTQEAAPSLEEERDLGVVFPSNAAEAAHALGKVEEGSSYGVNPDGSRWWKETGIETRPDGVVCKWTLRRGVSADGSVEWEDKFWEAADDFDYKELGSEKSGRDATGSVWREYWKEIMYQDEGFVHLEKTADKWGKNGQGDEWQEQWSEHYGGEGRAEKWAHKWCSIDPNTPLDAGHAHIWHERWGETYDGKGGSIKYTDKWAERFEGDGWTKWGDKWDENFDPNANGVKQGEAWWEGKHGERWNRTWGEGHNGSGWIHKYGRSSSGEHWDTHVQQDTWYERYPHYGFMHCFDNSAQLRRVRKPSEDDINGKLS